MVITGREGLLCGDDVTGGRRGYCVVITGRGGGGTVW